MTAVNLEIIGITPREVTIAGNVLTAAAAVTVDISDPVVQHDLQMHNGLWTTYADVQSTLANTPVAVADPSALTAASGTLPAASLSPGSAAVAASGVLTTSYNVLVTQYNKLQDDVEALWGVVNTAFAGLKDNGILADP